jgi:hypothetical protein
VLAWCLPYRLGISHFKEEETMRKSNYAQLLLVSAVAFTFNAFAQQGVPPTETQMRDNATTQQRDPDVTKRQKGYYNSLDKGNKGYLSSDDVSADPFLSQNYGKCDADHDGKLTWQEFKSCTHNNPAPQP